MEVAEGYKNEVRDLCVHRCVPVEAKDNRIRLLAGSKLLN